MSAGSREGPRRSGHRMHLRVQCWSYRVAVALTLVGWCVMCSIATPGAYGEQEPNPEEPNTAAWLQKLTTEQLLQMTGGFSQFGSHRTRRQNRVSSGVAELRRRVLLFTEKDRVTAARIESGIAAKLASPDSARIPVEVLEAFSKNPVYIRIPISVAAYTQILNSLNYGLEMDSENGPKIGSDGFAQVKRGGIPAIDAAVRANNVWALFAVRERMPKEISVWVRKEGETRGRSKQVAFDWQERLIRVSELDPSVTVRSAALGCISKSNDVRIINALIQRIRKDPDAIVRSTALTALLEGPDKNEMLPRLLIPEVLDLGVDLLVHSKEPTLRRYLAFSFTKLACPDESTKNNPRFISSIERVVNDVSHSSGAKTEYKIMLDTLQEFLDQRKRRGASAPAESGDLETHPPVVPATDHRRTSLPVLPLDLRCGDLGTRPPAVADRAGFRRTARGSHKTA